MAVAPWGVGRGCECYFEGVEEGVAEREEVLGGGEGGEGGRGGGSSGCKGNGGVGCWGEGWGEGFQGDGGDVVQRDEADAVPCAENLGVGLDEDVPADAAAFSAFCVQERWEWEEGGVGVGVGGEALGMALGEGGCGL